MNTLLTACFSSVWVNFVRGMRRKEKAIEHIEEMNHILQTAKHITIAMCEDNIPYLVTLSHGYDPEEHIIYFHCASEGKKIDILKKNSVVWGQALIDEGYVQGQNYSQRWRMLNYQWHWRKSGHGHRKKRPWAF